MSTETIHPATDAYILHTGTVEWTSFAAGWDACEAERARRQAEWRAANRRKREERMAEAKARRSASAQKRKGRPKRRWYITPAKNDGGDPGFWVADKPLATPFDCNFVSWSPHMKRAYCNGCPGPLVATSTSCPHALAVKRKMSRPK